MAEPSPQIRLFVGVQVSMATVDSLSELVASFRRDVRLPIRWVAPASYHITLKFLGWSRPEATAAVRDALVAAAAGKPRFEFETRGLGAFPKPERARVLWAGVRERGGGEQFVDLAARVDARLGELGYAAETRRFHPHVTLGRFKSPADAARIIAENTERTFRKTSARAVLLYQSVMKSTGSEYTVLARVPLGEAA